MIRAFVLVVALVALSGCAEKPQVTGADEAPKGAVSSELGNTTGGPKVAPRPDIR